MSDYYSRIRQISKRRNFYVDFCNLESSRQEQPQGRRISTKGSCQSNLGSLTDNDKAGESSMDTNNYVGKCVIWKSCNFYNLIIFFFTI